MIKPNIEAINKAKIVNTKISIMKTKVPNT
jgi:hypothetical protein